MKRSLFIATGASLVLSVTPSFAANPSTAVVLNSNVPDLDPGFLDYYDQALNSRGISVLDPSSISLTYHERASFVGQAFSTGFVLSAERVAWLDVHFRSQRVLAAQLFLHSTVLPYGDFTVNFVKATCGFRCMDVKTRSIVCSGQTQGEDHSEDLHASLLAAGNRAILSAARNASLELQ